MINRNDPPPQFTRCPIEAHLVAERGTLQVAGLPPLPIGMIERGAHELVPALLAIGVDPHATTEGSDWTNAEVLTYEILAWLWEEALPALGGVRVTTEYATQMSGGGMHVRNPEPEIEEVYPLAQWIKHMQRAGATVFSREVIQASDWAEVEERPEDGE